MVPSATPATRVRSAMVSSIPIVSRTAAASCREALHIAAAAMVCGSAVRVPCLCQPE